MSKVTVYVCKNIGIDGLTDVHIKKEGETFTARMGFSLFGEGMMSEVQLDACGHNPFDEDFFDNYVEGTGSSEQEAILSMQQKLEQIGSSLWD